MKITILGSGSTHGTPKINCQCKNCISGLKRLRSGFIVETGDKNILVDPNPDIRFQLLEYPKMPDAIIATHMHFDHIGGLGDIIGEKIPLYATKDVLDYLLGYFGYMIEENRIDPNPIKIFQKFNIGDVEVKLFPVIHTSSPLTSVGIKIYDGSEFVYSGDTGYKLDEESLYTMKKADLLLIEATFYKEHFPTIHLRLEDTIRLTKELDPEKAIFTHISHKNLSQYDLEKYVGLIFDNVLIARDFMQVEV
ncbi:MAG: MBL fold metallo-hydrolase [Candidatus Hydrothermarchaeota archaeon]